MKYLVIRKNEPADFSPFTEKVSSRGGGGEVELPFTCEVVDMDAKEAGDVRDDPEVDEVVPSIPFSLIEPLEDLPEPPAPSKWGLDAVGATTSPFTGRGVTVAVLDTGIDRDHEAFAGISFTDKNLMDFIEDESGVPGSAVDFHGHGTHVAGTIFGRPVNGERIGVAPGIERVLIGKVIGPNGGPTEAVFNAIQWALRERADIISMSLGINFPGTVAKMVTEGLPPDIAASRALEAYRANVRLFDRLAQLVDARREAGRGALLIAASGNESRRKQSSAFTVAVAPPAAADGFISVGAVAPTGNPAKPFEVASFSNTGCALAAPGTSIVSAKRGGGLTAKDGTSMATPHVAGVAALWTQKLFSTPTNRPGSWARDVQRKLETQVTAPPNLPRRDIGLGIVQAPQS